MYTQLNSLATYLKDSEKFSKLLEGFLKIYYKYKEILDSEPIIKFSTTSGTLNINLSIISEFD